MIPRSGPRLSHAPFPVRQPVSRTCPAGRSEARFSLRAPVRTGCRRPRPAFRAGPGSPLPASREPSGSAGRVPDPAGGPAPSRRPRASAAGNPRAPPPARSPFGRRRPETPGVGTARPRRLLQAGRDASRARGRTGRAGPSRACGATVPRVRFPRGAERRTARPGRLPRDLPEPSPAGKATRHGRRGRRTVPAGSGNAPVGRRYTAGRTRSGPAASALANESRSLIVRLNTSPRGSESGSGQK